jgi:DNA recombination protein RmuC
MQILYLVLAFLTGLVIAWIIIKSLESRRRSELERSISAMDKETGILKDRLGSSQEENQKLQQELGSERQMKGEMTATIARQEADMKNLKERLDSQKAEIEELQKKFTSEFENIANKILKENSREFTSLNQKNIGDILVPLKEKIEKFEKKVDDTYEKGLRNQTELRSEIKNLHELNSRISEEANNLTRALKSDSKKMGNWGELILDRILEQSGLEKGKEYYSQMTDRAEDGTILRPDVVIRLPESKHIIIDSKVSLIAYDRFVNSMDENDKDRWQKAHIDSVREHIKGLSEKNYAEAVNIDSPDFVLLFMPLESAFSLAIQHDS